MQTDLRVAWGRLGLRHPVPLSSVLRTGTDGMREDTVLSVPGICWLCKHQIPAKDLANVMKLVKYSPSLRANLAVFLPLLEKNSTPAFPTGPGGDQVVFIPRPPSCPCMQKGMHWLPAQPCFCVPLISLFRGSPRSPESHAFACLSY